MIAGKIKHLYPNAIIGPVGDVVLATIDGVTRIEQWNDTKLGPQPDMATIDAVTTEDAEDAIKESDAGAAVGRKDKAMLALIASLHGLTEQAVTQQYKTFFKQK